MISGKKTGYTLYICFSQIYVFHFLFLEKIYFYPIRNSWTCTPHSTYLLPSNLRWWSLKYFEFAWGPCLMKCAQNTKRYIIFFQAYNRLRLCVWRETGIWLWRTTTVFPRRDPPYRRSSVTSEYVRLGKESDKNPKSSSLHSWMEAFSFS